MAGMILRNKQGQTIMDLTMSISQNMGWVDTGGNGSASLPSAPDGKAMYYHIVPLVDLQREKGKRPGLPCRVTPWRGTTPLLRAGVTSPRIVEYFSGTSNAAYFQKTQRLACVQQ